MRLAWFSIHSSSCRSCIDAPKALTGCAACKVETYYVTPCHHDQTIDLARLSFRRSPRIGTQEATASALARSRKLAKPTWADIGHGGIGSEAGTDEYSSYYAGPVSRTTR